MKKPKPKRYRLNHTEARGTVSVQKDYYGLAVTVSENGTKWEFLIDLFHLAVPDCPDAGRCVQVVAYHPEYPDRDPVQYLRIYPDGRVETLQC